MHFELTREYIDGLKTVISTKDESLALMMLEDLHAVDIAELYSEISIEEAKFLFLIMNKELAADVISELEEDEREKFLKAIPSEVIASQFIDEMDSDDAADVLGLLPEEKKEEVLNYISDVEQAGDIAALLAYDEDSAGGLMATELVKANENWNVTTCLKEIRKQAEEIDELYYVYVVDDDNVLKGTLSLKKLLLSSSNEKVKNIYKSDIILVKTDTSSEDVAHIMDKYDLVSLPVVDKLGRLVGRITIDDVVDIIKEEAERDYQMISGISGDVESSDKILVLTRSRLPWLLVGIVGSLTGAWVMSGYEGELGLYPQLAFFVPLIAATGGNAGVQSSSIIVQSLANNTLGIESTGKKLMKELVIALLNGSILSSIVIMVTYFFLHSAALTITVSVSLFSVILFATVFGAFVPLMLDKFKIDPALATGPFITTSNDIIGLFIYFIIGRFVYGFF